MMDLGCYPLHWALSVFGEAPTAIDASATLTPVGVDESMTADLSFASGATAHLTSSMAAEMAFHAEMKLIGSTGEIEFINPLAPHHPLLPGRLRTTAGREADISSTPTYNYQLAAIIEALRSGAVLPTEGDNILRQQEALDEVYVAAGLRHLRYIS